MTTAPEPTKRSLLLPGIFALTLCGGIGLVALSIWPGVLEDVVFGMPGIVVIVPLLGAWSLLLFGLAIRDVVREIQVPGTRPRWGIHSMGTMLITLSLLWFHVPQRLALAACHAQFESLIEMIIPDRVGTQPLDQRIGPYRVDHGGSDQEGGFYFRTHTGPDGLGPDRMSYGFAFQPQRRSTPFGSADYRLRRLFGEWYVFTVSDDW